MKKEEIIKNLEKWSVIFSENQSGFSVEDYREIKKALIDKVIKPNKNDWEIRDILTCKGVYGEQTDTVLINKTTKLKYDDAGILIEDSGKIHYKKGFTDEEWKEIENSINKQEKETPQNPREEFQAQQEQPPKEINYMGYIYHRGNRC